MGVRGFLYDELSGEFLSEEHGWNGEEASIRNDWDVVVGSLLSCAAIISGGTMDEQMEGRSLYIVPTAFGASKNEPIRLAFK